jgi:hypothetical protein
MKYPRLGKKEYVPDPRTVNLGEYILPDVRAPINFNFDHFRRPFPLNMWGNEAWHSGVIASIANQLLRLGRIEQFQTLKLHNRDAVERYTQATGSRIPGDRRDKGMMALDAMRTWRNKGWVLPTKHGVRNYNIAAYGEVEPNNPEQLRLACYVLHGVHIGFWLPRAARSMAEWGIWDYDGQSGPMWDPGSWGGQLAYSKAYDKDSIEILAWGRPIRVSHAFIERYADEAWGVVADLDDWRAAQSLDVEALNQHIRDATGKISREVIPDQ